jgi:predicted nicotinamide N-methyase
MMNIAEAAAAAAKRQGRFREYDHIADGGLISGTSSGGEEHGVKTCDLEASSSSSSTSSTKLLEVPFDVSEIRLFPASPHNSLLPNQEFDEEFNWKIAHVADLKSLHLYTTKEKTRCELWARMWSTSRILAEMLSSKDVSSHLLNVNVLEIGAGTAVCGMIAAHHGANVKVTDSSEQSLTLASRSASLNGLDPSTFKTQRLNWHSDDEEMPTLEPSFHLLLGSDVLFLEMNIRPVIKVISKYVIPGGLAVILDPGRPCADDFMAQCEEEESSNLSVEKLVLHDLIIGGGGDSLMKCAVLYLVSVAITDSSNITTTTSSSNIAQMEQIAQLKQTIKDSWSFIGEERTAGTEETRAGRNYEYTENLN